MSTTQRFEIRIAGFGGQGVVTIGRVLGEALTIHQGLNSVNTRSYGPESRGGACRSEVVASQGEIHYPGVRQADLLVALSQPALEAYLAELKPEGLLLVDPNSVQEPPRDRPVHQVPAMEIARAVGSVKYQNAVALGAVAALLAELVTKESVAQAVAENVPPHTRADNLAAFERGWEYLHENR